MWNENKQVADFSTWRTSIAHREIVLNLSNHNFCSDHFVTENLNVYAKYPSATEFFNEYSMAITVQKQLVSFTADAPHAIRYRVFDTHFSNYEDSTFTRRRYAIMRHLHEFDNLALVTLRRPRKELIWKLLCQ